MSNLTREEQILLQCLNEIGPDHSTAFMQHFMNFNSPVLKAMRMFALEELEACDVLGSNKARIDELKDKLKYH